MKNNTRQGFSRNEHGAAAVEFAIVSGAFISFIFAIAYLGIMLFTDMALHWAVERSTRLAVIDTATTQSAIQTEVNGFLSSMGIPTATVSYSVAAGAGAFPVAHITATLTQSYTVPLISTFNITYSADAYVAQPTLT